MPVSKFIKKMMFARQLEFKEGRFEMLGIRGVILPAFTLTKLVEEVHKEKGGKVFDILFEAGKHHGKLGIQEIGEKHSMSKRKFLNKVIDSGNVMGLGKAEIELLDPKKKLLKVRLEDSPFKHHFEESDILSGVDHPIDSFQQGIFHAMAEEMFDQEMVSEESSCAFLGDDYCEFKIKPK